MNKVIDRQYFENHNLYQLSHAVDVTVDSLNLIANQLKDAMSGRTKAVTHVVIESDTIRSIATRYYGNINMWRPLAKHNNVGTVLVPGTVLVIPDREVLNGI